MSGRVDITKLLVILLLVGNFGFLIYNGLSYYDRAFTRDDEVEKQHARAVKIRRMALDYRADIMRIKRGNIIAIKDVTNYFENQARRAKIDPLRDGLNIPLQSKVSKGGRKYQEETWTMSFTKRDRFFSLKTIANFCKLIEDEAPGFQVKSIDFGQRSPTWGKDEWKVQSIVVRRLSNKVK